MSRIIIVDDDSSVLSAFERVLGEHEHEITTLTRATAALERLEDDCPDLLIMDIRMPGMSGLEALRRIRERWPRLPVIIMTGYATMEAAVEATKLGAFDYHVKPLEGEAILRSVENALQCLRLMTREVRMDGETESDVDDSIIGRSRRMQDVYKAIGRVAPTDAAVLIRGETGTGKELVARAIYQHSLRAQAPLIIINCAAIPETLLESELFGHERGAFTGADRRRIGKLEQADGGTLFLDEIGDMLLGTQAKLLRVLQDHLFQRLGGSESIRADLRVLAATNRDLEQAIVQGAFRPDLFHRLNVFSIHVPPLRERAEDIPRLATYFADRFARDLGIECPLIAPEALDALCRYRWPGNVRELEHCLNRAIIQTRGYPVQAGDIQRALASTSAPAKRELAGDDQSRIHQIIQDYLRTYTGQAAHADFLDMVEKLLLADALELVNGNQTHAARLLGMARPTLKARLDRHELRPTRPA